MKKNHMLITSVSVALLISAVCFIALNKHPQIKDLLIDVSVFPTGWRADPEGAKPSPSAPFGGIKSEERATLFFESVTSSASEEIERFKSKHQATKEFSYKKNWLFRDDKEEGSYSIPDELPYRSLVAEQYYFACIRLDYYPYPYLGCSYLAQYGQYIVTFDIGWNLNAMSANDLEKILQAIDAKMSQ